MKCKSIIMDHDGSADDFLSLILLLSMENINLLAVTLTPADCFIENALETTLKIFKRAKKTGIEIGLGDFNGINAFPSEWRAKPKIYNALPGFIGIDVPSDPLQFKSSTEVIATSILSSEDPVEVLLTGPCSNLVQAIEKYPLIVDRISKIVWMAGAFDVAGNVKTYNQNGTAEWNVFWDYLSAKKLLRYKIPMVLIPLDVTNKVPVTKDFLKLLAGRSTHFWSDLACQIWATTLDTIPAYEYIYFMWDVLATSFLRIPDAFTTEHTEIDIDVIGASAGRTIKRSNSGNWVKIANDVDKNMFYKYLLDSFSSDF